jgi:hypothetical protein
MFLSFGNLSKRLRGIIISVLALCFLFVFGYVFWYFFGTHVPSSFSQARIAAFEYAQNLSDALKDTPSNLHKIQELEKQSKDDQALALLVEEIKKNQIATEASINLSKELEKMAQDIAYIRPKRSAQKALVAITAETQLIYKLVSFNNYMAQLLRLLQDKVTGKIYSVEKINQLVDVLNSEVDSINQLNSQFRDYLNDFDGLLN